MHHLAVARIGNTPNAHDGLGGAHAWRHWTRFVRPGGFPVSMSSSRKPAVSPTQIVTRRNAWGAGSSRKPNYADSPAARSITANSLLATFIRVRLRVYLFFSSHALSGLNLAEFPSGDFSLRLAL